MHLIQVPASGAKTLWPTVEPFVAKACDHSERTHTPASTFKAIEDGFVQLWIAVREDKSVSAAATTSIQLNRSGVRTFVIELMGGDDLSGVINLRKNLEDFAKIEDCSYVAIYARKGWIRRLRDYRLTHYLLMKEI